MRAAALPGKAIRISGEWLAPPARGPYISAGEDDLPLHGNHAGRPDGMEAVMAWFLISIAGVLEIVWAYFMKRSEGFTKPVDSVLCLAFMGVSFWLLSVGMKSLPMGTAYAVWTGIGALGAFVVGVVMMGEPASWMRTGSAGLILIGIIGLRLAEKA
jgi:quaternary ammonium compound-resistance protein SugE